MLGTKTLVLFTVATLCAASDFNGAHALEWTQKAVALGPRPAGSPAIQKLQAMIRAELKANGWAVSEDAFTADTPVGKVKMINIIGKLPGKSGKAVLFTGHYDTKAMPGVHFVGANDGGASTGWLLEMARVLPKAPRKDDVWLVFFDGEEAYGQWSDTNGVFGSRHLADVWYKDGTLSKVKALFNVDMIGDKDLKLVEEQNSVYSLRQLVKESAKSVGMSQYFPDNPGGLDDDHMPFLKKGVNAVDLIDFDYGPNHSYWHTEKDTMDKLSAQSLQVIGDVLLEAFRRLQQ